MFKKLLFGVILGMLVSSVAQAEIPRPMVYGITIPCSNLLYGTFDQTFPYRLFVLGIATGMNVERAYGSGNKTMTLPSNVFIAYVEDYCRRNKDSSLWLATVLTYLDLNGRY